MTLETDGVGDCRYTKNGTTAGTKTDEGNNFQVEVWDECVAAPGLCHTTSLPHSVAASSRRYKQSGQKNNRNRRMTMEKDNGETETKITAGGRKRNRKREEENGQQFSSILKAEV